MTKPLLELTSPDSNFSVTVGRSSPTFIYGVRNLPDGQGGFPAFIFDTQALTTDRVTGEVIVDDDYQYTYGGEDDRDLIHRSHEIPIGRFGFTRVDLTLTKDEEEDSDEAIYTREFEIAENFRRVTGETAFSAALGTESLGPITPGRDLRIGQNVKLRVWGLKVRVRVDGLTNGQYGWECSVASVPMLTARNLTGSWTKRVSPSIASSSDTYSDYDSGEMIHVGDEISHLSERASSLEGEQLLSNIGGSLEANRLQLMKKFRDGTEEIIDLGEISGGGGSGVVRVQKGSDGRLTVVYSEGPDDIYEADISDVSLEGDELVLKKGEEEFKRIPLPSGGGGVGNGNLSDVYLDLLRRSDASYSSFGLEDYIDDLPVGEPRPEEEDKTELTERLPHFYEDGSGTWVLRDPDGEHLETNPGVMLIRAFRGNREESELFLVRVISIRNPSYPNGERYSMLALTDSSRISISGNARINPRTGDSVFTTGIFHRKFRVAFGDPETGTPPSQAGGSSQTKLEWVFLPNAATRYKQQIAGGMDEPFLQGEKTVVSVRSDNPGFLTVKYSDSDEQTFQVGGGGSGGPGVESVSVQYGYLMVRMEGDPQPQIYPLLSSYDIDPVTMRRRGATDFIPYNENSEFIDYSRLSEGIISVDVSVFGLDHGNLYVKVMGDAIEPTEDDFYREFVIPVTHGTESQGFLEDRTYVRIPEHQPVRSIGGKGVAILSLDGFNQSTGEHSTGFDMLMGELNPDVFENIRVIISYRHNTRVYSA